MLVGMGLFVEGHSWVGFFRIRGSWGSWMYARIAMLPVVVGMLVRSDLSRLGTSKPLSPLGLMDLIGPEMYLIEFGSVGLPVG